MAFLSHYGTKLSAKQTGLSIRKGGFLFGKIDDDVLVGRGGVGRLFVESPLDWLEDAGIGAYNYEIVKKHFKVAYDLLFTLAPSSKSFLCLIISDKMFDFFAQYCD